MEWSFHSNQPIYTQLIEQLTLAILSGEYPTGGKLPAVRELAAEAGVNPNTMQRALAQLEQTGLLYTRRTSGRFVTEDETVIQEAKAEPGTRARGGVPCARWRSWAMTDRPRCSCCAAERRVTHMAVLTCNNLTKYFDHALALDHVNLEIQPGRIVGLLGPNGSGKTTLIKLANGLLTPSSGELRIDGQLPSPATRELVSYLPERPYLADWMTVSQLLDFFCDFYANFDRGAAEKMLMALQISPKLRIKQMSRARARRCSSSS